MLKNCISLAYLISSHTNIFRLLPHPPELILIDSLCNYILFAKSPRTGNSEQTFRFSSEATTYPPVYHTHRRLQTVRFIAERQAEKL